MQQHKIILEPSQEELFSYLEILYRDEPQTLMLVFAWLRQFGSMERDIGVLEVMCGTRHLSQAFEKEYGWNVDHHCQKLFYSSKNLKAF